MRDSLWTSALPQSQASPGVAAAPGVVAAPGVAAAQACGPAGCVCGSVKEV